MTGHAGRSDTSDATTGCCSSLPALARRVASRFARTHSGTCPYQVLRTHNDWYEREIDLPRVCGAKHNAREADGKHGRHGLGTKNTWVDGRVSTSQHVRPRRDDVITCVRAVAE